MLFSQMWFFVSVLLQASENSWKFGCEQAFFDGDVKSSSLLL